jgi:uncharacterized membrane protein YfcA
LDAFIGLLLDGTGLALWSFALLCGVSFLGSFIAAALGLGGGALVLATMALFLPPAVLIPLHGAVQLGSNFGRAALMRAHVLTEIVPAFLIGTILGAAIGVQLVIALPIALLQGVLAVFILYSTWAPKFQASNPRKRTFFGLGVVGAFLTMFVGATGSLVAPFAAAASDQRQQVVATHAALMTIQHGLKIIAFGVVGFAFGPYLALLIGLLACGFAGTYTGRHLLHRLPERAFRIGLKTILTLIALRLLYGAAGAGFG